MSWRLSFLAALLLAGAHLGAGEPAQVPATARGGETGEGNSPSEELSPYEQLLLAREPLLLRVRLLRARRYVFGVASDPEKGEQLERDIQAAFANLAALYERYLEEHPDDAGAHYDLGKLYYDEINDENRAVSLWLRTIELDPQFDPAYNSLAVHYADAAEHEEALRYITKALELNSELAVYQFNAATIYFNFRQTAMRMFRWSLPHTWRQVVYHYQQALELDSTNYAFARDYAQTFYFAAYFRVKPDYSRAQSAWHRALALAPSTWERVMVLTNLARVSLLADQRDAARQYLEQASQLAPDNAVVRTLQRKLANDEPLTLPGEMGHHRRGGGAGAPPRTR